MFKVAFASALVAAASAQSLTMFANQATGALSNNNNDNQSGLTGLANQANAAVAPILNQTNPVVQTSDAVYLNINNYEWALTEYGNEYEFSVTELMMNLNNLQPALAASLVNSGEYLQNNAQTIAGLLDTEAANLGITFDTPAPVTQGALALATSQYGSQLSQSSNSIADQANSNYQTAAQDFATNKNGVTTQVNQQIKQGLNNQETLSSAVSSAIATGLQNTGALNNIDYNSAVGSNNNIAALAGAVNTGNLANSVQGNINQASSLQSSAGQLSSLSNQGINAGANAAKNSMLPSGIVGAAQNAASGAASGASTAATSAVNNNAANAATNNVRSAVNNANSAISNAPNPITSALTNGANGAVSSAFNSATNSASNSANALTNAATNSAGNALSSAFGPQ